MNRMRLFIAVLLPNEARSKLMETIRQLKAHTQDGRFTQEENLHLTLAFLGELPANRISAIKKAMEDVKHLPFSLSFQQLGRFKREGGDIYWLGVPRQSQQPLQLIYSQLSAGLTREGFKLESRSFEPHLTLGRQIVVNPEFDRNQFSQSLPALTVPVSKISLMKSERLNGRLTYTEIYAKMLG